MFMMFATCPLSLSAMQADVALLWRHGSVTECLSIAFAGGAAKAAMAIAVCLLRGCMAKDGPAQCCSLMAPSADSAALAVSLAG